MSADKMPPLPRADYGLAFYDEGGMHEAPGEGYTTDQMHTYARAYAAEQTRELVEALRIHHEWGLLNMFGYSENGDERVAYRATAALIAKHKEQA